MICDNSPWQELSIDIKQYPPDFSGDSPFKWAENSRWTFSESTEDGSESTKYTVLMFTGVVYKHFAVLINASIHGAFDITVGEFLKL